MQARLVFLIGWLTATAALAQGTFTYTFDGDSSPMNVWATFQVGSNAVATGYLSTGAIISGYLLQGGHQWSIFDLRMPVDTITALPNGDGGNTALAADYNYNEIEIDGGQYTEPHTAIVYYPWVGTPAYYPRSAGKWNVTFNVPEPSVFALLAMGLVGTLCLRWAGWSKRYPARRSQSC